MKIRELKQKTKGELDHLLREKRERLRQLNFDLVSGKVKNIREIRMVRKDIARMLTIISEMSNVKAQMSNKVQNSKSK